MTQLIIIKRNIVLVFFFFCVTPIYLLTFARVQNLARIICDSEILSGGHPCVRLDIIANNLFNYSFLLNKKKVLMIIRS